jgi:methionine synthase I (cobalamin-dependent)
MHTVIRELLATGPVVTDGAWATQLQDCRLSGGACPDAWNLLHPDQVSAIACAYVAAGSQVILTNTFGANRIALGRHGLGHKVKAINREGVQLSRHAAGHWVRVFASMGPSGVLLATGEVSPETLQAAFEEQAVALACSGADALVLETFGDLVEAEIAVRAARQTGLPVIASLAFDAGRDRDRTLTGATPEQAVDTLGAAGVAAIGANCGCGAAEMLPVCERLRRAAGKSLPLWIKPNAGLPEWNGSRSVYRIDPEAFVAHASALVEAGADFIGGCCGTGPAMIRALRNAVGRYAPV